MRAVGVIFVGIMVAVTLAGCKAGPQTPHEVILQGASAWNQWRDANPGVPLDLAGIALEGVNLGGANLEGILLVGARLSGANLAGARLRNADLSGANLSKSNLSKADLTDANLTGTLLVEANLQGSLLTGATLSRADLQGATLAEANLANATVDALAHWNAVTSYAGTNIYRIVMAPAGFKEFAMAQGAVKSG